MRQHRNRINFFEFSKNILLFIWLSSLNLNFGCFQRPSRIRVGNNIIPEQILFTIVLHFILHSTAAAAAAAAARINVWKPSHHLLWTIPQSGIDCWD
jgi:hypothetical protein